jgi:hypothetical protein
MEWIPTTAVIGKHGVELLIVSLAVRGEDGGQGVVGGAFHVPHQSLV